MYCHTGGVVAFWIYLRYTDCEVSQMGKVIAFDVETPNSHNDRICSIGLSLIDDGIIVWSQNYMVNPECSFDNRNIQIHGIRPQDVEHAPTFPLIWEDIGS